jgi:hypothetical protein
MIEAFEATAVEDNVSKSRTTTLGGRSRSDHHLGTHSAGTTGRETLSRARLTDKDHQLIGVLAIGRYLSNQQLQRLFYAGRTAKTMCKRLRSLAGEGPRKFNRPYLRRLAYRTHDARYVDLWALTTAGYASAQTVLGTPLKVPREDVGAAFREHLVTLNELLVALIAPSTGTYARAKQTSFRWITSDLVRLPWRQYLQKAARQLERVVFPDAVLEFPASRRRLFLECEMGTQSIVSRTDQKAGSTVSKVENYAGFIRGFADSVKGETFYARKYPDGWTPEVLFLVRTTTRVKSVNEAIAQWRADRLGTALEARALTFDHACHELLSHIRGGTSGPHARGDICTTTLLGLVPVELAALREFYNATVLALKAARANARARREPVPEYPARTEEVQALIERLQAAVSRPLDSAPRNSP